MRIYLSLFMASLLLAAGSPGCSEKSEVTLKERAETISLAELQGVAEFLGHDLLEGRAPGVRGGDLSEIYMRSLFKFMDLKPGNGGSYMQPFTMQGFTNEGVSATSGKANLVYNEDITGTFTVGMGEVTVEGEVVFVGFGITTGIWNWDDYKDVDVKDKIVITRVNDPGMIDTTIFEGTTLTYFGRWTYHIEEAARRGAAGILMIHTDQSAGYNWDVVKNSWSGEEFCIASDLENNLKFRGWVRESSLEKLLQAHHISLNQLYEKSATREFQPVHPGFSLRFSGINSSRKVVINNVIAEIPGKSAKRIVLSAHIDHLGMDPLKEGDNIYNGTIDNGTAVGAMMLTAKILKEYQKELNYTITILACNAEESGLLGSKYYVRNTDRNNIIANINFESTPVWSKAESVMGIGAEFSGFGEIIQQLATSNGMKYSTFSLSNQGLFYRSDQFSFARYGIPAVWISAGEDEINGERNYTEFWGKDYHTVRDEFNPDWELEGMKQTISFALQLVDYLNTSGESPEWNAALPFPMER